MDMPRGVSRPRLDARATALTDLAAAVASGSGEAEYRRIHDEFVAAGLPASDALGTYLAIASTVGSARVVTAASGVAIVMGYDVDADLEGMS